MQLLTCRHVVQLHLTCVASDMCCCVVQLVAADAKAEKVVHAHPASDMWALGVLAYEMFAGCVSACFLHNCCLSVSSSLLSTDSQTC